VANKFKGEVSFNPGEKDYTLRYSANALCELEDALEMGVNAVATQLANPDSMRLKMVRVVFWAGLRDHHPDVTLLQAGEIITDLSLTKAMGLISSAFQLAFQDESKAHPPQPGKKSPGTVTVGSAGTGLQS
jgi:hypothetical protein